MEQKLAARWPGVAGDVLAALVVLLGGGVLGSLAGFGLGVDGVFGAAPPAFGDRPHEPRPFGPPNSLGFVLLVAAAGILFLRRRWPIPSFAAAFAIVIAAVAIGVPPVGPGIAATIAMFALAYRASRRLTLAVAAVTTATLIVLSFAVTGWQAFDVRVFQIGAAIAVAAALGDSARSRHEYLEETRDRAERAERTREAEAERRVSEERLRIARDLHDTVAHQISVISLNAGVASGTLRGDPEKAESALHAIRTASRGALGEIGELLRYLRSEDPTGAPQPGLERLDELVERMRAAGLAVRLEIEGEAARAEGTTGLTAYRVVQEGLTNAHKHGIGRRAAVRLEIDDEALSVRVENPVSQDGGADAASNGLGLVGIRERVAALGGTVDAGGHGGRFVLEARLPLTKGDRT